MAEAGKVGPQYLYPHEASEVRNVRVVGDLYELISLPNLLEDHHAPIPNNATRNEEAVIRSTKLLPLNLL